MFNMFDSAQSGRLSLSILLDNIKMLPWLLPGSMTCIYVNDARNRKTINLCLPNKDRMNEIIKAFSDFTRCRGGDDLKPISIDSIKKLVLMNNCTETINNISQSKPESVIILIYFLEF